MSEATTDHRALTQSCSDRAQEYSTDTERLTSTLIGQLRELKACGWNVALNERRRKRTVRSHDIEGEI